MKRVCFQAPVTVLSVLISAALILLARVDQAHGAPPNVLFIAVDDLNDWAGPFDGNLQAQTPQMDRFCRKGSVVFQNAHCAGPVCCPSRSALLSGFMPSRTGIYGNSQNMLDSKLVQTHATLPEYFSKNGYVTISAGKIFHKHGTANGFDEGHWAYDQWQRVAGGGGVDRNSLTSRNRNLIDGKPAAPSEHTGSGGTEFSWGPTTTGKEQTKDYLTAQWAAKQLQKPHDRPFFLAVGLSKPHLPWYVPQEFFDRYDIESVQIPEFRLDDLDDILTPGGRPKFRPTEDFLWLQEKQLFREAARAYLAACSYADECLGVIFDALEASPCADNTVVMVWGDHGWHLGEKLRYRKATIWSESTRLPLFVRMPGMEQQRQCVRPVNLIDLYPTLVEICGLPTKTGLDGRSFAPLLQDPERTWDYPTVTVRGEGDSTVTDGHWRYTRYSDGTEELYCLDDDPMEWTNRINDPAASDQKARLAPCLPRDFAPTLPAADPKWKKSAKQLDETIKPRRDLEQLK